LAERVKRCATRGPANADLAEYEREVCVTGLPGALSHTVGRLFRIRRSPRTAQVHEGKRRKQQCFFRTSCSSCWSWWKTISALRRVASDHKCSHL